MWRSGLRRAQENRNSFKYISHLKMVFMRQLTIKLPAATVIYWNTCQREEKHHAYAFSVFVSFGHWKFEIFPVAHGKAREKKLYWVSINCIFLFVWCQERKCNLSENNSRGKNGISWHKKSFISKLVLLYSHQGTKMSLLWSWKSCLHHSTVFFSFARFWCH